MNRTFALRSALAAAAAMGLASLAVADSEQTTRPVIRGSGTDVTIVYQSKLHPKLSWSAPAPAPAPSPAPPANATLTEAIRMKTAGATDQTVIAFLQKNEVDMPDVVDADTVRDLRKAGAGDAVVALVSRYSAIDIGTTAEDFAGPPPQFYDTQEAYTGAFPDLANLGYPFYGGYGGAFVGNGFRRFGPKVTPHRQIFKGGQPFPIARPLPAHFSRGAAMSHGMGTGAGMSGGRRPR